MKMKSSFSWQNGANKESIMYPIGILSLQGAFIEHEAMLHRLGASCMEIRNLKDLQQPISGLVLPGGESTVQGKLLQDEGLFEPLQKKIVGGLPVLATCAGLILLAKHLENDPTTWFGTLPVTVRRNAYGRQLGSFITTAPLRGIGDMTMNFIRAPYITKTDPAVEILAAVENRIVAVRYRNQLALSFHPEVGTDTRIHQMFLSMIEKQVSADR